MGRRCYDKAPASFCPYQEENDTHGGVFSSSVFPYSWAARCSLKVAGEEAAVCATPFPAGQGEAGAREAAVTGSSMWVKPVTAQVILLLPFSVFYIFL